MNSRENLMTGPLHNSPLFYITFFRQKYTVQCECENLKIWAFNSDSRAARRKIGGTEETYQAPFTVPDLASRAETILLSLSSSLGQVSETELIPSAKEIEQKYESEIAVVLSNLCDERPTVLLAGLLPDRKGCEETVGRIFCWRADRGRPLFGVSAAFSAHIFALSFDVV